jgi:hypothetical protein
VRTSIEKHVHIRDKIKFICQHGKRAGKGRIRELVEPADGVDPVRVVLEPSREPWLDIVPDFAEGTFQAASASELVRILPLLVAVAGFAAAASAVEDLGS